MPAVMLRYNMKPICAPSGRRRCCLLWVNRGAYLVARLADNYLYVLSIVALQGGRHSA